MRVDAKVDGNQPAIVEALRKAGALVQHLHTIGHGCPDLLVGYAGRLTLLEVKAPKKALTPAEHNWHIEWRGYPVAIVHSETEALAAVGAERN